LADFQKTNESQNPEIIQGWKGIANFAGYSERMVKNFEKQGMKVHRAPRGKKIKVFAYASDIRDFVNAHLEAKNLDPDDLPPTKENKAFPRSWWFTGIAAALLLLATFLIWRPTKRATGDPAIARDIGYYQWVENEQNLPIRLDLFDNRGERIRTLWTVDSGRDRNQLHEFKWYGLPPAIAIRKGNENRPTILLETLEKEAVIHTIDQKTTLKLPDLNIQTLEPRYFDEFDWTVACSRIDSPAFNGWALLVQDFELFPSCLILLDEDFQEVARLYHAGRLRQILPKDQSLIIGGVLNARPLDESLYRPALFKLSIADILGCRCQIMPFSAKTIANLERRNYYQFKDLPPCPIDVYLALAPAHQFVFRISNPGHQLEFGSSLDNEKRMNLIFDWDLTFIEKRVIDHDYRGDFDQDYFKTRFQYWLGDFWGPWEGVYPK